MKNKTHHLFYLYCPNGLDSLRRSGPVSLCKSGWVIIILLLFSASAIAQEQTPSQEFQIGGKLGRDPQNLENTFETYVDCGFNAIWWEAYPYVSEYLDGKNLNLLAENGHSRDDFIYHYATGYYSKWEAEQNQVDYHVGVKHKVGQSAFWYDPELNDTVLCWSTEGLSAPACSLIYGPHYRQEKRYKRWYEEQGYDRYDLRYTVRFRMALTKSPGILEDEDVCVIKVVYRYYEVYSPNEYQDFDTVFVQKTLKVQDFLDDGEFKYFELSEYMYPEKFRPPELDGLTDYDYKLELPPPTGTTYNDTEAGTGIQYWVEWLRTDELCTLYVDNIEVYDNDGWDDYINPLTHDDVIQNIKNYAGSYSYWSYLKYWYAHDEPYTIDAFIPYHTVEQIVMDTTVIPLITEFYPYWTHDDSKINGEDFLQQWYDIGQPEKLMIDYYPFTPDYPFRKKDVEEMNIRFQKCSELQPGFWYSAQAFGYKLNGNWKVWRLPSSEEFNASIMLGLAHGMQGIMLYSYTSFGNWRGIVDNRENEPIKTHLWYHLKDKLIPRLKGKLGKTLMSLDYTGNYINMEYHEEPNPESMENDYLSIQHYGMSYFWHAGFFEHKNLPNNKYFLLTNLRVNNDVEAKLIVSNNTSYENVSFKDIEGGVGRVDTTIGLGNSITYYETMPAGEGRLYRVSPVIKYGGKLIYPETISSTTTLQDEMIIKNGATLTVNATYNVYADIRIKEGGRIVTTGNGVINFYQGHKLIIEGSAILNGTVSNKLIIDFTNPVNSNGIIIKPGGSLAISYCEIKNAVKGITSELNLYNLNIQNVNFVDCDSVAIYITGRNRSLEELTLTPPPPQIKYCNITNSDFGILVSNLSQIVI